MELIVKRKGFSMDYGIKSRVLEEICDFARLYDIERVYLFGSRARGDYKERSDSIM